jgi:AcrR family transcriptional regulator
MESLVATHPSLRPLLIDPRASRRARLLEGMTQAVYEKGYAAATVADAVRNAHVSRGTFYAEFDSKEMCFLEAYRHGVDVLVERVAAAARAAQAEGGWRKGLRAGVRAYLESLAGEPRFARTYLLEIHAAGPSAQAARDDALRRFAARYGASFAADRNDGADRPLPSPDLLFVLAAGVDQLICAHVREGAFERLVGLEDTLVLSAVALKEGVAAVHEHGGP